MDNFYETYFAVRCDCGCGWIKAAYERFEMDDVYASINIDACDDTLTGRIKAAWRMLFFGKAHMTEILLKDGNIDRFKDWVNNEWK